MNIYEIFNLRIKGTNYLFYGYLIMIIGSFLIATIIVFYAIFLMFSIINIEQVTIMAIKSAIKNVFLIAFTASFILNLITYFLISLGWRFWALFNKRFAIFFFSAILVIIFSTISYILGILTIDYYVEQIKIERQNSFIFEEAYQNLNVFYYIVNLPANILAIVLFLGTYLLAQMHKQLILKISSILSISFYIIFVIFNFPIMLNLLNIINISEILYLIILIILVVVGIVGLVALILLPVGLYMLKSKIIKEKNLLPPIPM